ncbi:hypothetical protein BU52_14355 [Streptomyces toyocaensis]|uniref:DUF4190 domain-containing protein n=2 Tax=Streptomyces toyocaensis TaxID=55952 RepID=A0A081XSS0_STRTO|nr:hypothetical protein BU52_14355 [Streptomyces toyocaensis]
MADDAQTPQQRERAAGGVPTGEPHTGAVWPAPADGGARDAVAQDGSLVDVRTTGTPAPVSTPDPWAPPADRTPAPGPGAGGPRSDGRGTGGGGAGGPGETVVAGGPRPWSAPSAPAAPSGPSPATPSSVHDQQTVTSFPAVGGHPTAPQQHTQPWAGPSAPHTPVPPAANPFAPPVGGGPVPPPPIGPEGPGQVPYGYPGTGYGGAPVQGYSGWSGGAPLPSNGLGVTGLVLGIISAAVFCVWPVAILLGVLAVIFGGIGRGKAHRGEATNAGQALAGIICGAVGVALGIAFGAFVLLT